MSLLDQPRSPAESVIAVVAAAVLVHSGETLSEALDAVERQVYDVASVAVVGGGDEERSAAEGRGHRWMPDLGFFLDAVGPEVTHVWLLHDDARPRPDALGALVFEAGRVGAEVAGAKILRHQSAGVLESVGMATDVYEIPYSGLVTDEVDQEQYDVVRDVAFVAGVSVLIRLDVLTDIGGLDEALAPEAAAIDLCQRAHLAGARVIVVPSAEVHHHSSCRPRRKRWREDAGRIRAMLKAYSLVTLLWAVPATFLLGVVESLLSPLVGRWRLGDFLRAWAWNLVRLPQTVRRRRGVVRRKRDEELFRYQVRGSVQLRTLAGALTDRAHRGADSDVARSLAALVGRGRDTSRRPVVAAGLGAVAVVLVATRRIIGEGLPFTGFSLPFPASPLAALDAYAGGWNVAGLGSPHPLRPSIALSALAQGAVLGNARAGEALVTAGALILGVFGMARLLRAYGLHPLARYGAGLVLVLGPGAAELADLGAWPAMVAAGALPWALVPLVEGRPGLWAGLGRVVRVAVPTAVAVAYLPPLLVAPLAAIAVWVVVDRHHRASALAVAALGAVAAIPLLLPWAGTELDLDGIGGMLGAGLPAYWEPGLVAMAAVAALTVLVLVAGEATLVTVAGWGAIVAATGALVARSGNAGGGLEAGAAGLVAVSLGSALVVGAGIELAMRLPGRGGWSRALLLPAVAALAVAAGVVVATGVDGRAGLEPDPTAAALAFTETLSDEGAARVLLIGPPETLPGSSRALGGGIGYRVAAAPLPASWEAWLAPPRLGDAELEAAMARLAAGGGFRFGEAVAPFGVRWIAVTGAAPALEAELERQLDLIRLPTGEVPVYEVEGGAARAATADGEAWGWDAPDYEGTAASTVRLAENADQRWGPGRWAQAGWANEVGGEAGRASFGPIRPLRAAAAAAGIYLLLLGALWLATRRRS